MKTECTVIDVPEMVEQFRAKINESANSIEEAARIYYNAVHGSPEAAALFRSAFPSVSSRTWSNFMKLAQGALLKSLVFNGSHGAVALSYCDIDSQKVFTTNPVPVMLSNGDILQIHLDKLTGFQSRQVFNRGSVRDLAEQRAWIETQKTRAKITKTKMVDRENGVFVKGNRLHVGELKFSKADLLRYIKMMES